MNDKRLAYSGGSQCVKPTKSEPGQVNYQLTKIQYTELLGKVI